MPAKKLLPLLLIGLMLVLVAGCAPGNDRWSVEHRAGFWAGLWHGLIIIVTFVVSLFTKEVGIYESSNVGWGYNIGFILGCMMSLGGGIRGLTHRRRKVRVVSRSPDWDKLAGRVEAGVKEGIKAAFEGREQPDDAEWDELGRRIEERVREKLRDLEKE